MLITNIKELEQIKDEFEQKYSTNFIEKNKSDIHELNDSKIEIEFLDKPEEKSAHGMFEKIIEFETDSWKPKKLGLNTGFDKLNKAFGGGLKKGFYVVGGDSNLGKSGFVSQLSSQVAKNNEDTFVLDFSLDDSMDDKIPRIIGSQYKVYLNCVKSPLQYAQYPGMLIRRKEGLNNLKAISYKYEIFDSNSSIFVEDIKEIILNKIELLKKEDAYEDKQIAVFIDSFHDLNTHVSYSSDKQRYTLIAEWCADITNELNIALVVTAELVKLYNNRRPNADDLREAVKIKYEAKAILMCYNDVHYNGDDATIFYTKKNDDKKSPVFEVDIVKNKISSDKGMMFYYFMPEMASFTEVDDEDEKAFINSMSVG